MSRPLRLEYPGAVYHIMARGDRRNLIFRDDMDRRRFLELLGMEVLQQRWHVYAYCLMGNHYHLLLETPQGNLVAGMRRLNGVYTQAFNKRHDLVGHVLQGRYKSIIVERDAYLLELARYVVLNPLRANLVRDVQEWNWSSYQATAGLVPQPGWLSDDAIVRLFGDDLQLARGRYRAFVHEGSNASSPWQLVRGQIFLGTERFLQDMEARAARMDLTNVPRAHRFPSRPDAETLLSAVAESFGSTSGEIEARQDQPAFQAWVYLMRRAANLSLNEVALRAGVSAGRVSQIQSALEAGGRTARLVNLLDRYEV